MTLGERGEQLIKKYEQLRLKAYMPTPEDRATLGWGHTKGVRMGDVCTTEQADRWFTEDVSKFELHVQALAVPLTQSMFDALVSLLYNVGPSCLNPGMIIGDALRRGAYYVACGGFINWRKQSGKDLLGLARRRVSEMGLFLEDGIPKP